MVSGSFQQKLKYNALRDLLANIYQLVENSTLKYDTVQFKVPHDNMNWTRCKVYQANIPVGESDHGIDPPLPTARGTEMVYCHTSLIL